VVDVGPPALVEVTYEQTKRYAVVPTVCGGLLFLLLISAITPVWLATGTGEIGTAHSWSQLKIKIEPKWLQKQTVDSCT
jgi:hypothetical protein